MCIAYIHIYLRIYACVCWAADDLNRAVLVEKHAMSVIQDSRLGLNVIVARSRNHS